MLLFEKSVKSCPKFLEAKEPCITDTPTLFNTTKLNRNLWPILSKDYCDLKIKKLL